MNRVVTFVVDNENNEYPKLKEIQVKDAHGRTSVYSYTVDTYNNYYMYRLSKFKPPLLPGSTYLYNNEDFKYELKEIKTSYGGTVQYKYDYKTFYFYDTALQTRVVTEKHVQFSPGTSFNSWYFSYPGYQNNNDRTVTVTGPENVAKISYYAHTPDSSGTLAEKGWTTGLIQKKWFTDDSYSEEYEWTPEEITGLDWLVLGYNVGKIKAPLIGKIIKTGKGDAESTVEQLYERSDTRKYGLPTKIKYYGGSTGTTLKNYKTLEYYYETNSIFRSKYMLNYIKNEKIYNPGLIQLKEVQTDYYYGTGNCGAIDRIRQWRTGNEYLTWDYGYSGANPNDITITIDLPGSSGTETYRYRYGTLAEILRPGYTGLTRSISSYSSAIMSETNQHGGTMNFTYDNLNRVTFLDMPTGFNDINVTWSTNSVAITQGGNTVNKYWDGLGRDTGFTESGDGITLHHRKTLDAEGRIDTESKGSTNSAHTFAYQRDDAGNPTRITDPRGKITNITYYDDSKTVTDAENHQTSFYYQDLPGLMTTLKDALNKNAEYSYDWIGRLVEVEYDNSRTQTYEYNGLDQVTSEAHPETGSISYTYNPENNLWKKLWGGITHTYTYNTSNQLKQINTNDEIVDYTFDTNGRVQNISSNNGWVRDQLTYNKLGSLLTERQTIPGLTAKIISYDYDDNNNLEFINYPDGRHANTTNNGLNMPETISFNSKLLISQSTYGTAKQPVSLTIPGNNTSFTASYNEIGALAAISLKKGSTTHLNGVYGYDNVGNITSISSTVPSLNVNCSYDDLYRLTYASYNGGKYYNYGYDTWGNLRTARENGFPVFDRYYNTKNQFSGTNYDYDSRGNLVTAPGVQNVWDNQDRLITNKSDTGEIIANHFYNEQGLRVKSSKVPSPSISILSPTPGQIWNKNGTYSITWSITGLMDEYVKIVLMQGETQALGIINPTENDGIYDWTIPIGVQTGEYSILVQTVDNQFSGLSELFSISGTNTINSFTEITGGEISADTRDSTGAAWADYDNDNDLDLFVANFNQTNFLFKNNGSGYFTKYLSGAIINDVNNSQNGSWGDYDNDGDMDLFVPNYDQQNCLYMNNGNQTFTKTSSGVSGPGKSFGSVWGDYDNDGWIDLFVANYNEKNYLYKNNKNGTFTKIPNGSIVNDIENSTSGNWCDYDDDGDLDLFVSNYNQNNSLYKNNGDGTFTKFTSGEIVNDGGKSYGSAWGDFDNDGDFDLFVNNLENQNNFFYKNDGNGTFTKITGIDLVTEAGNSHEANWGDFDNDGDLDLFVLNAFADNFLFQNNGDSTFSKITAAAIVPNMDDARGKSWGDYDNDGDLDLFITKYDNNNALFRNDGNNNSWIMIKCVGNSSNRAGIGARVKVKATINGSTRWQVKEINERYGLKGAFGLGDASIIDEIQVEWPSGISQTLYNKSINQYLTITEPEQKSLTVTSPNGGEILEVGAANEIKWNSTGAINSVDLECSIDNGTSWINIITSTTNDGTYEWTIPGTPSNNCLIRITESGGTTIDTSDAVFIIATVVVPTITITSPNGGEAWETGSIHDITWNRLESVGDVKIEYSIDNGANWSEIIASTVNDDIYYWTLPGTPSDNCLVRISELDGDPMDTSDNVFSITGSQPATITVTSPNGGEIWEIGSLHNITWTSTGSVGLVKIEYSTDNGTSWTTIASATSNDGSHSWTVPNNQSGDCLIRISEIDGDPVDMSNSIFSITAPQPLSITVTSPNGGETLEVGSSHNITWTSSGNVGDIKIEYTIDSGNSWTMVVSSTTNDGTYNWIIPNNLSDNCLIRISDIDGDPMDTSNTLFSIVAQQPVSITVISPNGGEVWEAGSAHNITWTSTGTIDNVNIEYSFNNGTGWNTIVNSTVNDGSYKWIVPDKQSEDCFVKVSSTDPVNPRYDGSDFPFTISTFPLTCGESWEIINITGVLYDVVYGDRVLESLGGPKFVAVGANGLVMTSSNGLNWVQQESGTNVNLNSVTFRFNEYSYSGWQFMAVGNSGKLLKSAGGTSWVDLTSNISLNLRKVDFFGGEFWIVGDSGAFLHGEVPPWDWTSEDPKTTLRLNDITQNSFYDIVVVGNNGVIRNRHNGGWNEFQDNLPVDLNGIAYGISNDIKSGLHVVVGDSGKIYTSIFGTSWNECPSGTTDNLFSVAFYNSQFIAVGGNGTILISKDGINWTKKNTVTTKTLYGVAYANRRFVVVGSNVIIYSECTPSIEIPSINITSPNGGENFNVGSTYNITWDSEGDVGNVTIGYSTDNGTSWTTIVSSTPNDGNYTWLVPDNPSDSCLIRISDSNGEPTDVSDAVFSIIILPKITTTSPNGGEHWTVDSSQVISWTSEGDIDQVKIEYSTDNGSNWTEISDSTENDGTFAWTIPGTPSNNCLVRVSEINDTASDTSDNKFSILLPSPITITSPNGGEDWEAGSSYDITWTGTGTFEHVKIEYSGNSGTSWQNIAESTANDGAYSWTVPDTPSDKCLVRIGVIETLVEEYPPDVSDTLFSILTNASSCGKTWKGADYSGSNVFTSVIYGNSQFVAVGQGGEIMISIDGMSWTPQSSGTNNHINEIAYGNNTFIAVGDNGLILTSPDGLTWTSQISGTSSGLQGIIHAGNKFTAVGANGVILTSPDSINWTSRGSGTSITLFDIAYDNNIDNFAVVGVNGTFLTSPDGIAWTNQSPGITETLYSISYADNRFVAVGEGGIILTGSDGINWDIRYSTVHTDLFQVFYDNSTFVIVGKYGEILTGYDGINWASRSSGVNNDLYGTAYGNSRFVTVGSEVILYSLCVPENPEITLTSPNGGESWSVGESHYITWTNSGNVGNVSIDYSTDNGGSWTEIISSTGNDGIHPWIIPDTPSDNCLVRISEIDGHPADISDLVFAIITGPEPTLTVTSPNGGETLFAGTTHEITWTSTGTLIDVNIEYSIDNGTIWKTIIHSTANDGSFDWTVPTVPGTPANPAEHCLVRISENDKDPKPVDTSDGEFTIIPLETDSLTLTSPNGRETLTLGTLHEITWTCTGTVVSVKQEYSLDSGATWTSIATEVENVGSSGSFNWIVPNTPSDHCLVRISDSDEDETLFDLSDAEFSIVAPASAALFLTSPNGGELWTVGFTYAITWSSSGSMGDIDLEYSTDSGNTWTVIVSGTANSGAYDWTIPDDPSDLCLVRVSETNGTLADTGDGVFSIVEPPTLTVTSPNGSETWEAGTVQPVTWTSTGLLPSVKIDYSTDSGATWTTIIPNMSNDGTFDWTVPDMPSENCLVRITGLGADTAPVDTSDAVFSIVSPAVPILRLISPNGGETLTVGTTHEIGWTGYGSIDEVKIEYSVDSGANWIEIIASTENDGSYDWAVPDSPSAACLVRVSETDGDPVDASDAEFTIASPSADTLTVTSPNGGETLTAGAAHEITWESSGNFDKVTIECSLDSGDSWVMIVTATANDGAYTWTVPDTASAACLVRIANSEPDQGPMDVSDAVFTIVSPGSVITVTSPNGAEGLVIGSTHEIGWAASVDITLVDIEYSLDNGSHWILIVSVEENDGSYTWTVPDTVSDLCLVRISDSDGDSAVWDVSDSVFAIVTEEPAACGGSWESSNNVGSEPFNAVTYGGGKFVVVGNNGVIKTGSDGNNWTGQTSNTTDDLYGVVYGLNMFVAVGENGTVLTSPNGIGWTARTSGTVDTLYSAAYGVNGFVAVGVGGTVLLSTDGVNWVDHSVNGSQILYGAGYGNGIYVVVGGGGVVFSSPDGVDWVERTSGTSQVLRGVSFADNRFVVVGDSGTIIICDNGMDWSRRSLSIDTDLLGVGFGNGLFVVVGSNGKILTSGDTSSWVSQASRVRNDLRGAGYGNLRFVVVGAADILFSMCDQSSANALNYKLQNTKYKQIPNYNVQNYNSIKIDSTGPHAPGSRPLILLLTPNGDEVLQAGEKFLIKWDSKSGVNKVKLEYSPDNGSTYFSIAGNLDNTGYYEWLVPHHITSSCLVRVSEVKNRKMPPYGLLYELNFKVNGTEFSTGGDIFSLHLGDAANNKIGNTLPMISFIQESNGKSYLRLYDHIKEIGLSSEINDQWHNIRILMDNVYDQISVILDGKLVLENIPRVAMAYFSPALSLTVGPNNTADVDIDDISVSACYLQEDKNQWMLLFNEDFERFDDGNGLEKHGWRTKGEQNKKILATDSHRLTQTVNGRLSLSCEKSCESLWQKNLGFRGDQVTVVKSFNVPSDFPWDISDKPFEIRYNDVMNSEIAIHEPVDTYPGFGGHGTSENYSYSATAARSAKSNSTLGSVQATTLVDTYYIYTYDGKLLAEYDHNGNCVRDYIYAGNRLIAEYYPPPVDKYYYYMPDQVNSVRMVTDDNGDVVYSAAFGPFGEVEKVWTTTYEPKLKFSGKERDGYTDLDYFGARYYDHRHYRFNSVDPVINRGEALLNPQLWNLYAYCRNNPLTYLDPTGMDSINVFLGFDETARLYFRPNVQGAPSSPIPFPDFKALSNDIHTVNMMSFTKKEFKASLQAENTWTFFIGDSAFDKYGIFYGMDFQDGEFHNLYLNNYIFSENEYVGVFSCSSSEYTLKIIFAQNLFYVKDGGNKFTSAHSLMNSAYSVIKTLVNGGSAKDAALSGTKSLGNFGLKIDKNDSIVAF